MHQWKEGSFETVTSAGCWNTRRLTYRGLGIEPVEGDDLGVWHTEWDVTHIASGVLLCTVVGLDEIEAFKLATMLADLTNWAEVDDLDELALDSPELIGQLILLSNLFGGSLAIRGVRTTPLRAATPHWVAR